MKISSRTRYVILCVLAFLGVLPSIAQLTGGASGVDLASSFDLKASTDVPNTVLKNGSYTIRVVDHLSDRVVLQVIKADGKVETTFLGVENSSLRQASSGPVIYGSHVSGTQALRGFSFPGGSSVEFVYPKQEAVAIAKANRSAVLAIDPSSEGRVEAKRLSKDDLTMVTLWTLTPTRVGPENDSQQAIAASRYQAPAPSPSAQRPVQVATNTVPPNVQSIHASALTTPMPVPHIHTKTVTSLPHTASNVPLLLLSGTLLLLASALLESIRRIHA